MYFEGVFVGVFVENEFVLCEVDCLWCYDFVGMLVFEYVVLVNVCFVCKGVFVDDCFVLGNLNVCVVVYYV